MLRRLLLRMRDRGLCQPAELARHLSVSEALVQSMLIELERQGYVTSTAVSAEYQCGACPLRMACTVKGTRLWTLTPKGTGQTSPPAAGVDETRSATDPKA
jgi:DNA-binding IclR family transcriptional regulator